MKFRILTCITAMTLFAVLAIPSQLAAQEQPQQAGKLQHYTITDLGTLGGTFSQANGINNRGWVTGFSTPPGDAVLHAFRWQNGVMTDLDTLGGPNSATPDDNHLISERGVVVGLSDSSIPDPNGEDACFDGTHLTCLPFVWQNGVMTALPLLGGNNGAAGGINNRGQIVGVAETPTPDPTCVPPLFLQIEAAIWEKGQVQELPPLPGDPDGFANSINDNGDAVGLSGSCVTASHAVLWQKGTPMDLGNLGGSGGNIAFDINNKGQVVGQSDLPDDTTHHGFLWQKGVMIDLGTILGLPVSLANGINNKGQVVGFSQDLNSNNTVAWIWQNGVMTDLNALIPPDSPWFLIEALGINDRGQIAGPAFNTSTGDYHAYLATPVESHEHGEVAVPGRTREKPRPVLPENVRKLLPQRLGFRGGYVGSPHTVMNGTAEISAPSASLSPTSLTFPTQAIGTKSAPKTATLKNTGTVSLSINNIAIMGSNAADFVQTHTCGTSLAAGASCTISVTFKPAASGTRTAALSVSNNAAGSPQKVTLSGIGTTAKLAPTSLNFGSVGFGATSLPKTVTLTNVGVAALKITGITISGPNAGDFSQTHSCGSSLSAGAACSIIVKFKPPVLGTRTAVLNVSDNAAGSPQKVALSGIGVNATLTGYCVHGVFDPHLGCRIDSDPTQCPAGQPAINPVTLDCGAVFQGPFYVDEARSCTVVVNGQRFGGACQYH